MAQAWNKGRLKISPEQMDYLIKNFANEENFILADTLGISESSLHRYARMHGLKKSRAFMRRCQVEATAAAKYFNEVSGRNKALSEKMRNGGMPAKFIERRFSKGDTLWNRCPEKMRKARRLGGQSLHATWEEERQRARLGIAPRTKLKVGTGEDKVTVKKRCSKRAYLRSRGYVIDGNIAYYDDKTKRSPFLERRDRMFCYILKTSSS